MRNYLRKMRDACHTSQQAIADCIGCRQAYYSMIENGDRQQDMSYSMMEKLAAAFGVPVQTIIDEEAAYIAARQTSA